MTDRACASPLESSLASMVPIQGLRPRGKTKCPVNGCPVNLPMIEGALGRSDLFCQLFLSLKSGSISQSYRIDRRVLPCDAPCYPPVRQCGANNRLTNFQGLMYEIELLLKPPRFLKCILDPRPWSRPWAMIYNLGRRLIDPS